MKSLSGLTSDATLHSPLCHDYNRFMEEHPRSTLYMIIETFKNRDGAPVYRRFRNQGRLAPDGLKYIQSWVTEDLTRCYQIMECSDPRLLDQWIARWSDLVDFEVVEIMPSAQAAEHFASRD